MHRRAQAGLDPAGRTSRGDESYAREERAGPAWAWTCRARPDGTVQNIVTFMATLRGMHAQDPLAFEVCVQRVVSVIEDQRRKGGPYRLARRPRPV